MFNETKYCYLSCWAGYLDELHAWKYERKQERSLEQTDHELLTKMAVQSSECLEWEFKASQINKQHLHNGEGTSNVLILPRTQQVSLDVDIIMPFMGTHQLCVTM